MLSDLSLRVPADCNGECDGSDLRVGQKSFDPRNGKTILTKSILNKNVSTPLQSIDVHASDAAAAAAGAVKRCSLEHCVDRDTTYGK